MSEPFDPYLRWLGIRDPIRPPNHYRLLGIELFESDPDVIATAADRQMAHVRTFQAGKHSAVSQRLLNELAAAKICLLQARKKADYDAKLRAAGTSAGSEAGGAPVVSEPPPLPPGPAAVKRREAPPIPPPLPPVAPPRLPAAAPLEEPPPLPTGPSKSADSWAGSTPAAKSKVEQRWSNPVLPKAKAPPELPDPASKPQAAEIWPELPVTVPQPPAAFSLGPTPAPAPETPGQEAQSRPPVWPDENPVKTGTGTATGGGSDPVMLQSVAEPVPVFISRPPVSLPPPPAERGWMEPLAAEIWTDSAPAAAAEPPDEPAESSPTAALVPPPDPPPVFSLASHGDDARPVPAPVFTDLTAREDAQSREKRTEKRASARRKGRRVPVASIFLGLLALIAVVGAAFWPAVKQRATEAVSWVEAKMKGEPPSQQTTAKSEPKAQTTAKPDAKSQPQPKPEDQSSTTQAIAAARVQMRNRQLHQAKQSLAAADNTANADHRKEVRRLQVLLGYLEQFQEGFRRGALDLSTTVVLPLPMSGDMARVVERKGNELTVAIGAKQTRYSLLNPPPDLALAVAARSLSSASNRALLYKAAYLIFDWSDERQRAINRQQALKYCEQARAGGLPVEELVEELRWSGATTPSKLEGARRDTAKPPARNPKS